MRTHTLAFFIDRRAVLRSEYYNSYYSSTTAVIFFFLFLFLLKKVLFRILSTKFTGKYFRILHVVLLIVSSVFFKLYGGNHTGKCA